MKCYFGDHEATHIKQEAEYAYDEGAIESQTIVKLPICKACNEANYDGTEEYPRLLPLS